MNYAEFNKNLREDNLLPLYLFIGNEKYLIDDTINRIKSKYIDKSLESINFNVLNGKNTYQDDIVNACETLPFMSKKRLVILNELALFLEDGIIDEKQFYSYLDHIGDHCLFIITDREGSLKKTTKFYKYFKKKDRVVEFTKLNKAQLKTWIEKQLQKKHKEMTISNINYFMDRSLYFSKNHDIDLYSLKGELDKLISYTGSPEIRKSDIDSISKGLSDNNIFDLLASISHSNVDKSLEIFDHLYSLNEPALKILFMITRQIRLLISFKLYKDKGYQDKDIGSKLKIKPYELTKISQQSKNYSINELKKHLNNLLIADKKLKTSSADERLVMEMLIVKLTSKT